MSKITRKHALWCLLFIGSVCLALPVTAQGRPRAHGHGHVRVAFMPSGFYIGAGIVALSILAQKGEEELLDDGAGLSVYLGIPISERFSLEGAITSTFHNPETVLTAFGTDVDWLVLSAATLDGRFFFPRDGSATTPYIQVGLGAYVLDSDFFGTQSVGTGGQLGGGVEFDIAPSARLGLRGLYRAISMGPPEANYDDTFISALSLEANVTLLF